MPAPATSQPRPWAHLLVPLDGSRLAEAALTVAAVLAERAGASVTLLHILERNAPTTVHGDRHLASVGEAEAYLNGVASRFADVGVAVATHTHPSPEGDVAASVAAHAAEIGADLIVLCAHGSGGLRGWFSGAIAQRVIRQTRAPILLVRPPDSGGAAFVPTRVLVALDGAAEGELAIPAATALARTFGAELDLLMVVATLATVSGDRAATARLTPAATTAALDMESEQARDYLKGLCAQLGEATTVHGTVGRGDPVQTLVEHAAQTNAGVVALATHGRTGLEALWSGSVGAKLFARVTVPLLLVPAAAG